MLWEDATIEDADAICLITCVENGVLLILVVCGVERYALSLNQSSSLISKHFC